MTKAYLKGVKIAKLGKSIYFNPYRHKGAAQEFCDFESGWRSVKRNK